MGIKRKGLWTIVALLLAVLTIWAVVSQSGSMSMSELKAAFASANPVWLALAVLFMLGIIFWEGEAVLVIMKGIGYPRSHSRGFLYAAGDVYFSAITPSASGGQPASAYFMIKDGLPGALATAVLVLNLIMYTSAVLVLTWGSILFHPQLFWGFSVFSKILIIAGTLALGGLTVLFYLLLRKQQILFGLTQRLVRLLSKVRFIRHPERILEKLEKSEKEYKDCVTVMAGRRAMMVKAFLCNFLQRLSQFLVTVTVYLALGGKLSMVKDVFITQCMVTLGSNCVPIPGGMGIADYLMLDGFGQLLGKEQAFTLEMIGRGFSFYICILVSAVTVVFGYIGIRRRAGKKD